MQVNIHCNEGGLKSAIEDAFEHMEQDETQGFSYPIGTVNGMVIRIVADEPGLGMTETTHVKGPDDDPDETYFTFTAVTDLNE